MKIIPLNPAVVTAERHTCTSYLLFSILLVDPLLVGAGGDPVRPVPVLHGPGNGFPQARGKRLLGLLAQFLPELGKVDCVTRRSSVVAGAVLDVGDEVPAGTAVILRPDLVEDVEDHPDDGDILHLRGPARIVGLPTVIRFIIVQMASITIID